MLCCSPILNFWVEAILLSPLLPQWLGRRSGPPPPAAHILLIAPVLRKPKGSLSRVSPYACYFCALCTFLQCCHSVSSPTPPQDLPLLRPLCSRFPYFPVFPFIHKKKGFLWIFDFESTVVFFLSFTHALKIFLSF